jgi:FkbH-like protein
MDAQEFAARCREAASVAELRDALGARDPLGLTAREVAVAGRTVQRLAPPTDLRVAFMGTHTMAPLPNYLRVHGVAQGLGIECLETPYGQYMQQLLSADSEVIRFDPQLVVLSLAMRQLAPRVHARFSGLSPEDLRSERERLLEHVVQAAALAARRTSGVVLVANFPRPAYPALGIADAKQALGETEFYLRLNLELLERFRDSDRIHVLDLDRLVGGHRSESPDRMYFIAKTLWPESACNSLAVELMRYAIAATGRTRKCLVVDLDNTLWGGVVGEDGPSGIMVGPGSPGGEAYEAFQHAVRSLRDRGIMLAVCSKNNPADVQEAFRVRTDMPLAWEDFACGEVSWDHKAAGVRRVAQRLNIGEDSLVFLDDNPAERVVVRGIASSVTVPELPTDPADYARFLYSQVFFDKLRVKSDDLTRVLDYGAHQRREQLRGEAETLGQYLAQLETEVEIREASTADLARVHELFNKTNQFNLTTRRYSIADVEAFISHPQYLLGVLVARDRYGPMGTVGVFLLEREEAAVRLDSFLMSCRALGRGIETAGMNCVKELVGRRFSSSRLLGRFVPTAKNAPAKDFLPEQGFRELERGEDGTAWYEADAAALQPLPCDFLKVNVDPRMGENQA